MPEAGSLPDDLIELAQLGADGDGVSRFAWTPELMAAQRWLLERVEALGLSGGLDPAGNAIGRWEAGDGPVVAVGSHLDTVPRGGRFDGALGVLSGLDALRSLRARGARPAKPIWLLSFMDEEGARFRTALFGSRAFAGEPLGDIGERRDAAGVTLREAMAAADFDFDRLAGARAVDRLGCYVELHIEQGRVLEGAGADVGIVRGLAGIAGLRVTLRGAADHAGTTPMTDRRDALAGAARIVLELREYARRHPRLLRLTVGTLEIDAPGFNIVPGACELSIDLRGERAGDLVAARRWIEERLVRVAGEEGLAMQLEPTHEQPPHAFDDLVLDALRDAAEAEGASAVELTSGAGHDAMVIGRHVPAGMLFVPSRDGISHDPAEYTSDEQCEVGARVLARAVATLADAG